MKKLVLLSVVFILGFSSLSAQYNLSLNVGFSANNVYQDYADPKGEPATKFLFGYNFSMNLDYAYRTNLKFRSGLTYSSRGYALDLNKQYDLVDVNLQVDGYYRIRLNYLKVPFYVVTNIKNVIEISFGPYLGFGLGGRQTWDYIVTGSLAGVEVSYTRNDKALMKPLYTKTSSSDLASNEYGFYGLDYGLDFGLNYMLDDYTFVGFSISQGFSNLAPPLDSDTYDRNDYKAFNSSIIFNMGFFIN